MAKRKRDYEDGEWWISNAVDRQVVRNSNGQSIIMEPGDVIFVLNSEKSIKRVFKTQSHFMRFGGSLAGRYCIFPVDSDSPKLTQPAHFFKDIQSIIAYELNEDLMNPQTLALVQEYQQAHTPAGQPANA